MKARKITPLLVITTPLLTTTLTTSCSLFQGTNWSWLDTTKDNTVINYCLLIGQNDHTDSQMRTHGTRKALGTLDTEAAKKPGYNANTTDPVQGHITLYKDGNPDAPFYKEFVVNEIEHMEQKSMGGASWDPITANATASTWIAKHGNDITFFVSNNDAMAEGAYWASNWIKGLPIFGYDANSSTLQWVNDGGITGTVDQSPSNQAAAAMMMIRNMYDDKKLFWENGFKPEEANDFGAENYNPTYKGFKESHDKFGYVDDKYFTQRKDEKTGKTGILANRELKSRSTAITHIEKVAKYYWDDSQLTDIGNFILPDGKTAKQPKDMFDQFTHINKVTKEENKINICHTYSNRSEAFLIATMKPYFNEYASRLWIEPDAIEGDGTDETIILNQIKSRQKKYDAFLICLTKTTSAWQYVLDLSKIAFDTESKTGLSSGKTLKDAKTQALKDLYPGKYGSSYEWKWNNDPNWQGWDNWEERLDTPLIFWIREPSNADGSVDNNTLFNKFFKYTYYIGADSQHAGETQGKLITSVINQWYTESLEKK